MSQRREAVQVQSRSLGSLQVSVVGLGTNNFGTDFFGKPCDLDTATQIIAEALNAGVNFVDTAEEYSVRSQHGVGQSEQFIGQALKSLGVARHEVVIATKFLPADADHPDERGRARITRALEGSLRRLNVDHVDLYQHHRPDPDTPLEETLAALHDLVRSGKVREIGCSNYSGALIDEAQAVSQAKRIARFVTTQSRYNVLENPREDGVLDACERNSMVLLPYYPLANGLLTGKYGRSGAPAGSRLAAHTPIGDRYREALLTPEAFDAVAGLQSFAEARGHSLLELAISWLTSQPMVASVIAGATRPEQVAANAASASWSLSEQEIAEVRGIVKSHRE